MIKLKGVHASRLIWSFIFIVVTTMHFNFACAQKPILSYKVKDGKMFITIGKNIAASDLDSFVNQYSLADLYLKDFIQKSIKDSLLKEGWKIASNSKSAFVLSKDLMTLEDMNNPVEKFHITDLFDAENFENIQSVYGYNKFKNKIPFAVEGDNVIFYLKNNLNAKGVLLAGSFSKWRTNAIAMEKTDSGWVAKVKLLPGKYWYKFIVDGKWITDVNNLLLENDGNGNVNSVYYKTNIAFHLFGHVDARKVYVAGSFNNWNERDILMTKTTNGWQLPFYLNKGTHTYKFIVDNQWLTDESNPNRLPDGNGGFNSVFAFGNAHTFTLNGFTDAKQVFLSGTFNNWRNDELQMNKTATGWEIPYVIAPGNYLYNFVVDGITIATPDGIVQNEVNHSFITIEPNYTFSLSGFENATEVFLAGDFNQWESNSIRMERKGNKWTIDVYLHPGKNRYKFFVDNKWILDPGNKLWEDNEYHTGNSVVWIENSAFIP